MQFRTIVALEPRWFNLRGRFHRGSKEPKKPVVETLAKSSYIKEVRGAQTASPPQAGQRIPSAIDRNCPCFA